MEQKKILNSVNIFGWLVLNRKMIFQNIKIPLCRRKFEIAQKKY